MKDLSKIMAKKGHNVFVVFIDRASESGRDADFEASFIAELTDFGVGYGFIGSSCRKNPLKGIAGLYKFCRKFNPDVIHSHLYYGAVYSFFQFGVPHVYTHHNIKLKTKPVMYKFLDLRTSSYIGICNACTNMLRSVTRKEVVNIDNGVDAARIIPKKNYLPSKPLRVVSIGTLSIQKNHELLFRAISALVDLDFTVTVAGEGSQTARLKNLVDELGIAQKVTFIGNSSNVKQLLHDSDLFVMCSAWEGLPIVQIEATLTGLPVLVTDVGGCSEIVNSVGNGLVADVEFDDYVQKLERLIVDDSIRLKFHENALAHSGKYTVDNAVNSHLELYGKVVKKSISHV